MESVVAAQIGKVGECLGSNAVNGKITHSAGNSNHIAVIRFYADIAIGEITYNRGNFLGVNNNRAVLHRYNGAYGAYTLFQIVTANG